MGKRVGQIAKVPEVKQSNSNFRVRRTKRLQSMDTPADHILFLQRTAGNQVVSRLMESGALQAKLRIGQPGDVYEQEADRVADAVMRMPEPGVQRQVEPEEEEEETLQTKPLVNQITPLVQVQCQEELEEEETLQAKEAPDKTPKVTPYLESRIQVLRGGGQPLPKSVRAFFEPRFGNDFNKVRIHTDTRAGKTAEALNALAFTTGRDVFFRHGTFNPGTSSGRQLLSHELTHVVQQTQWQQEEEKKESLQFKTAVVMVQRWGEKKKRPTPFLVRVGERMSLPIQFALKSKRAMERNAWQAANKLYKLLKQPSPKARVIRNILLSRHIQNLTSWLKEVEKQYNYLYERKPLKKGGVTKWVPIPPAVFFPMHHDGPVRKLVVLSPLRAHLKDKLGDEADKIIEKLDMATPTRPLTEKQRIERIWRPAAEEALSRSDREFAITVARKMGNVSGPTYSRVEALDLSSWLFSEPVWPIMYMKGHIIKYHTIEGGGSLNVKAILKKHKSYWRKGGAVAFLQKFGQMLHNQFGHFHEELVWFENPFFARNMNVCSRLPGAKKNISNYETAWREIGRLTGNLETIQNKIVAPNSPKKDYIWDEQKRSDELDYWDEPMKTCEM